MRSDKHPWSEEGTFPRLLRIAAHTNKAVWIRLCVMNWGKEFTCRHRSEPGRWLMLGKWDLMANFLGVGFELSGGWHYPVLASTMCGKRQFAAEICPRREAVGQRVFAESGFLGGGNLAFPGNAGLSTAEGELSVVCRRMCSGKMYGVGAGSLVLVVAWPAPWVRFCK
jgi:hypothetical protein